MQNFIKKNSDLILVLAIGAMLLLIAQVEQLTYLRWVLGILFVFFLSGYPLSVIFTPNSDWQERLVTSIGFSLLLTYPSAIINSALEGKTGEVVYSEHLMGSLCVLFSLTFISAGVIFFMRRGKKVHRMKMPKLEGLPIMIVLMVSAVLNFMSLSRASLNGDEYDIGYRSYYLVDGMVAGRNGYLLSFMGHSPLAAFINHFSMQILNSTGFENLSEWMVRFAGSLTGVICVFLVYIIGREFFNKKVGITAALLVAISNYHVWMSRIFLREIFMTLFILLIIYFVLKLLKTDNRKYIWLIGIFFGGLLLTKITGVFVGGLVLVTLLVFQKKKAIKNLIKIFGISLAVFSPVILYNIGAYFTTGYMDIFFSRIFGIYHPYGYTGDKSHTASFDFQDNILGIFELLIDQYSLVLFVLFVAGLCYAFYKKSKKPELVIQILFIAITIVFFIISGTRAYYMPFITIPFAILTANFLEGQCKRKWLTGLSLVIMGYGTIYTYNTNILDTYTVDAIWNDSGRPGAERLTIEPLTYNYSRSTRPWVEDYGWADLQELIEDLNPELLIFDDELNAQMIQFYFDAQHVVKQFYFEDQYEEKYNTILYSEFLENRQAGILITEKTLDYELIEVVKTFNVYQTSIAELL